MAEYFFFDEYGFLSITEKKILECYSELTEALRIIYNNVKGYYNKFTQKVIYEDDLNVIDFPRIAKEIEMKGLEYYFEKEKRVVFDSPEVKIRMAKPIDADEETVSVEQSTAAFEENKEES